MNVDAAAIGKNWRNRYLSIHKMLERTSHWLAIRWHGGEGVRGFLRLSGWKPV